MGLEPGGSGCSGLIVGITPGAGWLKAFYPQSGRVAVPEAAQGIRDGLELVVSPMKSKLWCLLPALCIPP